MNKLHEWANTALIALLITLMLVGGNQSASFRGVTNFDSLTLSEDLIVTDDATVSGGSFTLTTSNSATSTATIGCFQTYATSTATAIRMGYDLTSTTTVKNQYGTTVGGFVTWGYGTCPF